MMYDTVFNPLVAWIAFFCLVIWFGGPTLSNREMRQLQRMKDLATALEIQTYTTWQRAEGAIKCISVLLFMLSFYLSTIHTGLFQALSAVFCFGILPLFILAASQLRDMAMSSLPQVTT